MKIAKDFKHCLQSAPWNYELKVIKEPKYHLGGDLFCDKYGTICYGAQTYIYETMFGEKPKEYIPTMKDMDHPKLDLSEFFNDDDIN